MTRKTISSVSSPATRRIPDEVADWIVRGRDDFPLFCEKGFGVILHSAQVEAAQAILKGDHAYYVLSWANRAGKTTLLGLLHLHALWYKRGMATPRTSDELKHWRIADYRTLHAAPLNELAGKAQAEISELLKGTSRAQRDPVTGHRRDAPLAQFFVAGRETDKAGSPHMILRCLLHSAATDFRSTEGKANRLEGSSWWFISWDEWPQQENIDDIRYVLEVRLTNRAADYASPIVLTGTITPETEHLARDFLNRAEDTTNADWWANHAARSLNPSTNLEAIGRAARNLDPEDYARAILGVPGGQKGRLIPSFLLDPAFRSELPRFQPPDTSEPAKYAYLHSWDLALSQADNVGFVFRVPADWRFSVENPVVGVEMVVIPGSRTLTDDELIHAIMKNFLAYRGRVVVDATDAHGKNIHRLLRRQEVPCEGWVANERDTRGVRRKDTAISRLRDLMSEGMVLERDRANEIVYDEEGVPRYDRTKPYGAIVMPAAWTLARDQLAVLREDNEKQRKDAAMAVIQAADSLFRIRRAKTHRAKPVYLRWSAPYLSGR